MPTFDIAGRAKIWFTISLVIICLGIFSFIMRGFNFGTDLKFEKPVNFDLKEIE